MKKLIETHSNNFNISCFVYEKRLGAPFRMQLVYNQ